MNDKYHIEQLLSSGTNSRVYIGKNIETQFKVIIKTIPIKSKNIRGIQKEIEIPKLFDHPNIVNIIESFNKEDTISIIYKYHENSIELTKIKLLKHNIGYYLNIFYQITDGIEYMHNKKIVHMDIKPQNIIIYDGIPIIIDFNLSLNLDNYSSFSGWIGTPNYMSPELWKKEYDIDYYLCDIYSLGVTFYYVINNGKLPFRAKTREELEDKVTLCHPIKSNCGIFILDKLIMNMIKKNPNKRPRLSEIKNIISQLISIYPS